MDVRNITNSRMIQFKQNPTGNSAISGPVPNSNEYHSVPLEVSKAYVTPQIKPPFREIQTLKLPYLGEGKVYELSNGHKIILVPKMGQTVIHTYVGVGEVNEPPSLKGASHLLEHLVAGYCSLPKTSEIKKNLSEIGASCNARNDKNFTGYYIEASITNPDEFEKMIKLQSEMIQNKNFADEDIVNEANIITKELDSRGRLTSNYLLANEITTQNLLGLNNSNDITLQKPSNINKEDLLNYYNTFYRPDNMVTTIVGPIDENSIKIIAKYFNYQSKQSQSPQNNTQIQNSKINQIQKAIRKDIQSLDKNENMAYVNMTVIGPENNDDKEIALVTTLRFIVNQRIEKNNLNQEYSSIPLHFSQDTISSNKTAPSILRLRGNISDSKIEDNLQSIHSIFEDLKQNPVPEEELKNIKQNIKSDWSYFAEDSFQLSSILSEKALLSQNIDKSKEFTMINSITPEDIQKTAQKYLDINKSLTVIIHPQKIGENQKAKDVSFKGNGNQINSEDIKEYILPNNLRVVIDSRQGIARSTVRFDLLSEKNLTPSENTAFTMLRLIGSEEKKKKLDQDDISLTIDGNPQEVIAILNGDADKTTQMLNYATDILLNPDFSSPKFYTTKLMIDRAMSNPNQTLNEKIDTEISGDSPYYLNMGSNPDMKLDDVKDFHRQILQNAQGVVVITIPKENLKDVQDEIFKKLNKVPNLKPYNYGNISAKSNSHPLAGTKIFLEPKNDSQIEINKIFKIIDSDNINDAAGLSILNLILGGNEKSKLYQQLRYKDKIAYDAYSEISYLQDHTNKLTLSTKVSAESSGKNIKTVITDFDKTIDELAEKPLTQEELDSAKRLLQKGLLSTLEKSSTRNDRIAGGYKSSYGINYDKSLSEAIDNVTVEDIQKLAKKYLKQPYLMTASGNKEAIEANKDYFARFGNVEILQS